jgi:hypothetical protein
MVPTYADPREYTIHSLHDWALELSGKSRVSVGSAKMQSPKFVLSLRVNCWRTELPLLRGMSSYHEAIEMGRVSGSADLWRVEIKDLWPPQLWSAS